MALYHLFIIPTGIAALLIFVREKKSLPWSTKSLIGLIIVIYMSLLFSDNIQNTFKAYSNTKYYIAGILGYLAIDCFWRIFRYKNASKILSIFFFALIVANIAGLYEFFYGYNPLRFRERIDDLRAAGMYGMAITYGYGIGLVSTILLGFLLFFKKIKRKINISTILFSVALASSLLGLYFSYTRGALLALIVSLPFLSFKYSKKLTLGISAISAAIIVGWYLIAANNHGNEMRNTNRYFWNPQSETNTIRLSQYQGTWEMFKENPWFGVGFRQVEYNIVDVKTRHQIGFADWQGHAHNNYLEMLAGVGVFGFIFLSCFFLFWFKEVWKDQSLTGKIAPAGVVYIFISGLFQNTMTDGENMFHIMFFYSLSMALIHGQQPKISKTSS